MAFWQDVEAKLKKDKKEEPRKNEIVIDLQKQLSKLEFPDIDYIYNLLLNQQYRGRDIEMATTVLLKIRFIRNQLKENVDESTEVENG